MRRFALHAKFYYAILMEDLYWAISVTARNQYRASFRRWDDTPQKSARGSTTPTAPSPNATTFRNSIIKLFAFHYTPANLAIWLMYGKARARSQNVLFAHTIYCANIPIGKLNCPDFHGCFCRPFPPFDAHRALAASCGNRNSDIQRVYAVFEFYETSLERKYKSFNRCVFWN